MKWKEILFASITILIVATAFISGNNGSSESEINAASDAYSEAFNQRDINKLLSLWADDATYNDLLTGDTYEGKAEIEQLLKDQFAIDPNARLRLKINNLEIKGPDKAIEKGLAIMSFSDKPEETSAYNAEYVNQNGKWLLQKVENVELVNPTSNYDNLKDLEWLVGNWGDKDPNDDVDVSSSYNWDLNKNFLIQHFSMSIMGQKDLEGHQIIGWDPVTNKIHSWIFDSDGGFGESTWNKEGDKWYANLVFNLPSGAKGSSTHILTKIDEDTFNFAAVNRDAGGDLLPDIGPFKVIRKK